MTIGKNNLKKRLHKDSTRRVGHYSLSKLSVGVASVLLSTTLFFGVIGSVDTNFTLGLTSVEAASATPVVSASDGDDYSDSIEKAGGPNPNGSNSTPENYGKEPTTPNEGGTTTDPTNPTEDSTTEQPSG